MWRPAVVVLAVDADGEKPAHAARALLGAGGDGDCAPECVADGDAVGDGVIFIANGTGRAPLRDDVIRVVVGGVDDAAQRVGQGHRATFAVVGHRGHGESVPVCDCACHGVIQCVKRDGGLRERAITRKKYLDITTHRFLYDVQIRSQCPSISQMYNVEMRPQ